jgi:hypothetical protein
MKMVALIEKMATDAFLASRRKIEEDRIFAVQLKRTPEAKAFEQRKHLRQLRARTAAIQNELKLKRDLEAETKRLVKAAMELQEATMTTDQRQERGAQVERMQILFSRVCPEASPLWREDADLAFRSRYAPTDKKV